MGKIGYLECPTGIAGDMCLSALIDCGLPWQYLVDSLQKLGIESEYQLRTEKVIRNGQLATKVYVDLKPEAQSSQAEHHHHHSARHLPEIESLIVSASLPERAKQWSLAVFKQLAIAEAQVHGIPPEKVHFHEVGATDAIIDIVGTCLGLDWLDLDELSCSAMPTGGGTVKAAHGILSVPVPAVVKLWETREVPIYSNGIKKELVTPTGAAIAITLASSFGEPPGMKLTKIGLGAGSKDLEIPNILRLWIGEKTAATAERSPIVVQETVTILETQIDDLNPQAVAYTLEQLMAAGALDVFTQNIGMKKSRSGILLTTICHPELAHTCKAIIFRETTTLGIRERNQSRSILNREIKSIETPYGTVRVKIASWQPEGEAKEVLNIQPEYEDCAALARQHNIPWKEVAQKAIMTTE
jgi:pyridinium-3,5-bisthiocarboxylic acid mononucleotide nickel chelatase